MLQCDLSFIYFVSWLVGWLALLAPRKLRISSTHLAQETRRYMYCKIQRMILKDSQETGTVPVKTGIKILV